MTIDELIERAVLEDIPKGDLTTDLIGEMDKVSKAQLIAKEDLILSGCELFEKVFKYIDPSVQLKWLFRDGDIVMNRQVIALITGNTANLLKAERVALNFLGKLSGIATYTRCFVEETHGTHCQILDTRKTTPLYRELEKKAVRDGGGHNHRMNLSDAILVKENHILAAGGIGAAIDKIRENSQLPIEIEVRNIKEAKEALDKSVEKILLDNMSTEDMRQVVQSASGNVSFEASGNMNLDRIQEVAQTGVHFISVGALTHSAGCADLSLIFNK